VLDLPAFTHLTHPAPPRPPLRLAAPPALVHPTWLPILQASASASGPLSDGTDNSGSLGNTGATSAALPATLASHGSKASAATTAGAALAAAAAAAGAGGFKSHASTPSPTPALGDADSMLAAELQLLMSCRPYGVPEPAQLRALSPAKLVRLLQECTPAIGRTVQALAAALQAQAASSTAGSHEGLPLDLLSAAANLEVTTAAAAAAAVAAAAVTSVVAGAGEGDGASAAGLDSSAPQAPSRPPAPAPAAAGTAACACARHGTWSPGGAAEAAAEDVVLAEQLLPPGGAPGAAGAAAGLWWSGPHRGDVLGHATGERGEGGSTQPLRRQGTQTTQEVHESTDRWPSQRSCHVEYASAFSYFP
jgi:hypothetical protein